MCREKWEGFPRVSILLRNTVEKLFPDETKQRTAEIQQDAEVLNSLNAFQKYGTKQASQGTNGQRGRGFFSGVLTTLTGVAVVFLVYHWSSRESEQDLLVHKPVAKWSTEEVFSWLEQLGPWAYLYKDRLLTEHVNGRLLLTLGYEELSGDPYFIENPTHRKAILMELEKVKTLGVKPPQNLWEYKVEDPSWKQWTEFFVKYVLLPYQLIAEFAWDWLEVHYWTSRFIIVNAMLLSVLEGFAFWRLWCRRELRSLPQRMWSHFWKTVSQGILFVILWPVIPQFVCNCLFYWAVYFNPVINIDLVVKEVRRLETQMP